MKRISHLATLPSKEIKNGEENTMQEKSKTKNMGAYLRKMAIDGYIVNTDTTPLKKQYEEMHKIGVNINQIAKKVNSTGDLYSEEMQELKEMEKEFWRILRSSPLK